MEEKVPPQPPQGAYPPPGAQGYAPPPGAPAQGYAPPPQGYAPPPQGYAPPPQGYAPPPQGYAPPPGQGYAPPGAYAPPQVGYAPQAGAVPAGGQWMAAPAAIPGCPQGLEYLTQVNQLLIQQKVELLEAFTGFETANKYQIKNTLGQNVYFAAEDSDCCTRQCCGPLRSFDMKILDNNQQEVIHLERPFRCASCWTPCCLQELVVSSPPGTVIGYVKQRWSPIYPNFDIEDANGDLILKIEGPCCAIGCGDVDFMVKSKDDTEIGKISKQWSGLAKELFTDADNFGIQFPMDLDVKAKACLVGAVFLIDFMFFEKTNNQNNQRTGVWQ